MQLFPPRGGGAAGGGGGAGKPEPRRGRGLRESWGKLRARARQERNGAAAGPRRRCGYRYSRGPRPPPGCPQPPCGAVGSAAALPRVRRGSLCAAARSGASRPGAFPAACGRRRSSCGQRGGVGVRGVPSRLPALSVCIALPRTRVKPVPVVVLGGFWPPWVRAARTWSRRSPQLRISRVRAAQPLRAGAAGPCAQISPPPPCPLRAPRKLGTKSRRGYSFIAWEPVCAMWFYGSGSGGAAFFSSPSKAH